MSFADRLRQARTEIKLTQNELARKIGVGNTAISNYEKGISFPNVETLYKLFEILQKDPNFLFQDEINLKGLALNNLETKLVKSFREINNEGQAYIIKTMEMAKKNFAIEKSEEQSNKVKEFPKTEINDKEIVSTAQSAAFGDGTELITYTKEEDEELSKLHDRLDEIFKK